MKVRFSDQTVRCRVSRDELDRLLQGRPVALEVALPRAHCFRVNVRPAAVNGWQLDSDPTGLWLAIPRSDLQALSEAVPSREGLEHLFDASGAALTVSFEVDLRD